MPILTNTCSSKSPFCPTKVKKDRIEETIKKQKEKRLSLVSEKRNKNSSPKTLENKEDKKNKKNKKNKQDEDIYIDKELFFGICIEDLDFHGTYFSDSEIIDPLFWELDF